MARAVDTSRCRGGGKCMRCMVRPVFCALLRQRRTASIGPCSLGGEILVRLITWCLLSQGRGTSRGSEGQSARARGRPLVPQIAPSTATTTSSSGHAEGRDLGVFGCYASLRAAPLKIT